MSAFLHSVVWPLIQPSNLLLIALCTGILLLWTQYHQHGRRLLVSALAAILIISFTPVNSLVILPLEDYFKNPEPLPATIDGIVVLGGGENIEVTASREQPTLTSAGNRLAAAVALALQYPEAAIVFSGGNSSGFNRDYTEATVARHFFSQFGLTEPRLILEDQARDTFENALLTKALLNPKANQTWVLVTSAMHMPRAVNVFQSLGWSVIPYPVDYTTTGQLHFSFSRQPLSKFLELDQAVTEWVGLFGYRVLGRTERLLPLRQ